MARYKRVRDVIMHGAVHRIGSPDQARCAVQYTLGDRVVVLAWNPDGLDGGGAVPARDVRLPLHGLPADARYRVVPTAAPPRPAQPGASQSDTTQHDTGQADCGGDAPAPVMSGPAAGFEASGRHLTSAGLPVRWTAAYDADLFELERL